MWRQGDVFIEEVPRVPTAAQARPVPHGTLVHGEITGHTHRVEDMAGAALFAGTAFGEMFLQVRGAFARIVHEEHGPIELPRGIYRVWRQREYSPERIRTVVD